MQEKFAPHMCSRYEVYKVAAYVLEATIQAAQKNTAASLTALEKAVRAEDSLIYSEPKRWMLPARQYLGALLLQQNKPGEAEKVYRDELIWNLG
ncbi:MAG: hypothetical protein M3Q06_11055, partial [Bacteroidota bacterium]|nr:hypothetical protein [Bacteroidota bacterium]